VLSARLILVFLFLCDTIVAINPDLKSFSTSKRKQGFIANKGQITDQNGIHRKDILFLFNLPNTNIYLRKSGFSYQMHQARKRSIVGTDSVNNLISTSRVDVEWLNANADIEISASQPYHSLSNYYSSKIKHPVSGVESFHEVCYKNVYKNIDLHYYEHEHGLKYDFILAPFADINQIQLKLKGAEKITLQSDGSVLINTKDGSIRDGAPIAYQNGKRITAHWCYQDSILSFKIPEYNPALSLIIDPLTRAWGTFYGNDDVEGTFCLTDKSGNVYLGGNVKSWSTSSGIATSGAYQQSFAGGKDCYIAKFNANGTRLWATYYGGAGYSEVTAGTLGPSGEIFVVGHTDSLFPVSNNCYQPQHGGGYWDLFVLKFDSAGNRDWCTFYGGSGDEYAGKCTVDKIGSLILTSGAQLIKLDNSGQKLWNITLPPYPSGCSADTLNNIYVIGTTGPDSTIATSGSHQQSVSCPWSFCYDMFIIKYNSSGQKLWGTFYGGSYNEYASVCKVDRENNLIVGGFVGGEPCSGSHGVTTPGSHREIFIGMPCTGGYNGIVGKFSSNGTLIWGSYLGAAYSEGGGLFTGCDIGPDNSIFLCGSTNVNDVIQADLGTTDAYKSFIPYSWPWNVNGFLTKLTSKGQLEWGTLYGGSGSDVVNSCSIDQLGNVYIVGTSYSKDTFELASPGAHDTHMGYGPEAFLAKFTDCQNVSLPSVSDITTSENKIICEGTSATLRVSYMTDVRWYASASDTTVLQNGTVYTTNTLSAGTYTYYAYGINNCHQAYPRTLVTITVSACVGVDEYRGNSFPLLFPNPAERNIQMGSDKECNVTLYDSMGETVWNGLIKSDTSIDITSMPQGIYIAKIFLNNNTYYQKLIISR
jgi:hypothetical protein